MGDERRDPGPGIGRRSFLAGSSSVLMAAGLVGGYGTFCHIAGRFLYPAARRKTRWLHAGDASRMNVGDSIEYRLPDGATVAITRRGATGNSDDFAALGNVCPHLGCHVHWESQNHRFFCPCHNGAFDPGGKATAGPPAEAGQVLPRFPLKVENGLLFIEVPEPGA
jgi:Rieske Fe-S protein